MGPEGQPAQEARVLMSYRLMNYRLSEECHSPPCFDISVPHPARMWNYWLGGKDHFAADREAAQQAAEVMPLLPMVARATRRFALAAVQELAIAGGIRQFLDIGTGLPVDDAAHEVVAQRIAPDTRVVYVDNDPIVASHANALLVGRGPGKADCLHLDLRDTSAILAGAAKTLDFGQPMVVLLSAILDFIPDADDPWAIVAQLHDALAPGSYVLIAHAASDIHSEAIAAMSDLYNERAAVPITPRSHAEVTRFFDDMTLTSPGVVPATGWCGSAVADTALSAYFGLGVKAA
jgi:SAM-dependent methyltransferase